MLEQAAGTVASRCETSFAQIITTPFHQHRREFARDDRIEKRQVFAEQLLLQTNGVRRDNDAAACCVVFVVLDGWDVRGVQNSRDEVRETLTDAGASLGDKMVVALQGFGNCVGHFQLLRALLEVLEPRRDAALGAEDVGGV